MGRIPNSKNAKKYICTICEDGACVLSFEDSCLIPCYCPFDRSFGKIKWDFICNDDIKIGGTDE